MRRTAAGADGDGTLRSEIDLAFSKTGIGAMVEVIVLTGRAVVGDDDGNATDGGDDDDEMMDGLNGDGVVDVNGRLFGANEMKKTTKTRIRH